MDELTRAGAASTWGVCTCSMGTLDGSADGPRPGVTCVMSAGQGPLGVGGSGIEEPVKVERPQRREDE
jgi:hypothetical protein